MLIFANKATNDQKDCVSKYTSDLISVWTAGPDFILVRELTDGS